MGTSTMDGVRATGETMGSSEFQRMIDRRRLMSGGVGGGVGGVGGVDGELIRVEGRGG